MGACTSTSFCTSGAAEDFGPGVDDAAKEDCG